jgi:hypothetical protein
LSNELSGIVALSENLPVLDVRLPRNCGHGLMQLVA